MLRMKFVKKLWRSPTTRLIRGGVSLLGGIGLMCIAGVLGMGTMFNPTAAADVGLLLMFLLLFGGLILCIIGLRKRIS